jgi:penicillin-binding protein 1B
VAQRSAKKRGAGSRRPPDGSFRRLAGAFVRFLVVVALAVSLVGVLYAIRLDGTVREKFEGKRWALPARVYARPLELYVGLPLTPETLEDELERLEFRQVEDPARPGTYHSRGGRYLVRTRPFRFWDGAEPERLLEIAFDGGRIASLRDAGGGPDPALARLDAALIANIYPAHNEDRVLVRREDLPPLLVDTLTAVEDRSFNVHPGVDPLAITRAMVRNIAAGTVVEGGSTLTQQLVKNFYLTHERSLSRKLNEAVMAVLLELHYSKGEILEAYANEIFLGQDGSRAIHGFGLASRFYFNRSLDELGVPETALLVALIKGPSHYDPRRHPQRAIERRNLVIGMLADEGVIDAERAAAAKRAPLGVSEKGGRPAGAYPAFLDLVRRQLRRDYREEDLRSEGLRIFTTLSPVVQSAAEDAVRQRLRKLEASRRFQPGTLEAAAVVASSAQGEVLALVGGRDTGYAGFNRALEAVRPIGSLIKPVIYLTALSDPERYSLATTISDSPVSMVAGGKVWRPQNYDRRSHGNVPLYKALARSYNLATVNLGLELGVDRVVEMLDDLGVQREVDAVPAMLLGSVSLAPVEVAQVYQSIAAGGFRTPLKAIREVLDAAGRPLNRYPLAVEPSADAKSVYLVTWAMRQVVEQGTATWLKDRLPGELTVAGKTGTTNGLRDSWFAGFSGDKVAVVWVGRDDNRPTKLTGSSGALRVWGDIMANVDNQPLQDLPPEGIEEVRVDVRNGLLASAGCGRAMTLPFDEEGVPRARSGCGAVAAKAPAPEPVAEAAEPKRKEKSSGGGFREFMGSFFSD